MFTGIIENVGRLTDIENSGENRILTVQSNISHELKIDQSVAHDGVCLTVTAVEDHAHQVVAIQETLKRSNLGSLEKDSMINLERCLKISDRLDGHMVQGHVDTTAKCISRENQNGSWLFRFKYEGDFDHLIVQKGSIAINGVSLTVVDPEDSSFGAAIIPYTFEHTNFKTLSPGDLVNIEFDILGKYIARHLATKTIRAYAQ